MAASDGADLTARLEQAREILHIEIQSARELLGARIEGMDVQRSVLLAGLNDRAQQLQEETGRRLRDLTRLLDERRDNAALANRVLQEEMDRRMDSLDKLDVQRYEDLKELVLTGQVAADKAVQAALASAEKAVIVAQEASEKRLDSMNEFRQTLSDQTSTFVPRNENDARLASLADRVTVNADRVTALELRLTTRLDRGEGVVHGQDRALGDPYEAKVLGADQGAYAAQARRAVISQIISGVAVLVSLLSVIIVLTLHK